MAPPWLPVLLCSQRVTEYATPSIRELSAVFSLLIAPLTPPLLPGSLLGCSITFHFQRRVLLDTIVSLKCSSPDVLSIDKSTIQISIIDCNMQN